MALMLRGNEVVWNRQLLYSGQHVAHNKLMWLHATDTPVTICCLQLCCAVVATKLPSVSLP